MDIPEQYLGYEWSEAGDGAVEFPNPKSSSTDYSPSASHVSVTTSAKVSIKSTPDIIPQSTGIGCSASQCSKDVVLPQRLADLLHKVLTYRRDIQYLIM